MEMHVSGLVIYVGSFSKTMLATLRMGFVVAPASLRDAGRAAKLLADWHTALPPQAALARFIEQGFFARHLRKMRAVYQARHQRIADALVHRFARHLEVVPSAAGLHLTAVAAPRPPRSSSATAPSPPTASTKGSTACAAASIPEPAGG